MASTAPTARDAFIEDIEWMLTTREHPDRIAARLGVTTNAVERRLWRAGRSDLARTFTRHQIRPAA